MKHLLLAIIVVLAAGCSNSELQPIDDQENLIVDDKLQISGEVCTSPPEEQVFPVKVMFIVDTSGSMQFTDPSDKAGDAVAACTSLCTDYTPVGMTVADCAGFCANADNPGRRAAVERVIQRFKNNPVVSFAIIAFNGRVSVNGLNNVSGADNLSAFTRDEALLNDGLESLMQADITTDYQGALSQAYQTLEKDMLNSDPVSRGRTKYVVIFLSDGGPNPVCKEGCEPEGPDVGVVVDNWCNLPKEDWTPDGMIGPAGGWTEWYPALLEPCRAYNTEEEILKKIYQILDLGTVYGVGEIRLHTAFLFVDSLPKGIADLFYDSTLSSEEQKAGAEGLLKEMAKAGDGLYRSFNSGQSIDFLDINYTAVARPFGLTNFIVTNTSALPNVDRLAIDTDGDGVSDSDEFEARMNMDDGNADSDGDGYNDRMEYDRRNIGFDPGNPNLPARRCRETERDDVDGDGLLACEEAILGTNPKLADSDRDRIPDGVEFWFGTDPIKNDAKTDPDFDGKFSDLEINIHSDPNVVDYGVQADYKYIYNIKEQPDRPDLLKCYDFNVRNIRLVTTKETLGAGTLGYNEILVYFGEGPADDPRDYGSFRAACVRAQYVEPSYKYPASGSITLTPANFLPLAELSHLRELARTDPTLDPCVGSPLPGAN
ncbi:MAG: VWA domain-containing protein [Deltaproteobacteria bacterium]|nr:VWA domain-containing protein [Deltaproteobacteria bacterium]